MFDEKSRIRRILYAFNIRKIFTPIRRFATPKEDPFAAITAFFSSLAPKQKEEIKFKGKVVKHREPIFRMVLLFAIFILVLGLAIYFITTIKITPYVPPPLPVLPAPIVDVNILDAGTLDAYESQVWYAALTINGSSLDYANLSLSVFKDFAPEEVFLLKSVKKDATRYDDFKRMLKAELEAEGMSITEITPDDLLRMPDSLKITLIVPTGYLPTFFLGMEDPNFDITKFTKRGNVIIYIGRSLTEHVIARNGELVDIPAETIEKNFGLVFQAETTDYEKFRPLYRLQQTSRSNIDIRSQIGSSSVTWGGGGYIYFLPTTLDAWWSFSGNKSADDISSIVANALWGYYYVSGASNLTADNETLNTTNMQLFTHKLTRRANEDLIKQAYGRLFIKTGKINDTAKTGKMLQVQFQSPPNGRIESYDKFISSSITGNDLDLSYSLNESVLREEQIFLKIINSQNKEVKSIPLGVKSLQVSRDVYRLNAAFPSGDYILKITDSADNSLAQSYLHLSPFSIVSKQMGWELKLFIFEVYAEDDNKAPYLGQINPVKVSLDGKDEKEIKVTNGKIAYESSYFPSPGDHVFTIVMGNDIVVKDEPYTRPASFIEKYWYMVLIVVVVFGIGFAIRRPEKAEYFVDVPDFPPLHSIAIPMKKETIIDMFTSVNKDLKWEYTPLSIQDLKPAFRKTNFQGRSIIIGDYNLENLLDKLIEEGYIKHALDYYGLVSWERESKKSIYKLAMQRALRDLFVIEGVPFLPFGQRTDCDTIASMGGEKIFLHIYENDSVIYKAVQTAPQGRTIIIFEDEQTMKDFTARVHSSSETNVVFKMLLDDPNGNIFLSPINKLIDAMNKKYNYFYY